MIRLAETSRSGKIYVGTDIQKFSASPEQKRYTKVILYADDDEGTYVQWPPETEEIEDGLTLEAKCPWGTEDIARSILESLQASEGRQDFHYRPYDGEKALLGPAVEIGDGITTNGVYSGIYKVVRKFGKHSVSNISAPITSEADHEIQYKSEADRRFIRQAQKVSAEFGLKMDKIYTSVKSEGRDFGWTLSDDNMVWTSGGAEVMKLTRSGLEITGSLTAKAVITGTLKVGDDDISANTLRTGAQWPSTRYGSGSYTNGSYALTYANNYDNATTANTRLYPAYFKVDSLNVMTNLWAKNMSFNGNALSLQTRTIAGTTIAFVGWGY